MADGNYSLEALLAQGLIKTSIDGNDYLVLRSWMGRANGTNARSEEYAIKITDLIGDLSNDMCNITLTPPPPTVLPAQTFDIPGVTPKEPRQNVGPAVLIPGVVEFMRWSDGGNIWNQIVDAGWNNDAPADTEWNSSFTDAGSSGFEDLSDLADRTYDTFIESLGSFGGVGNNILSTELVCHVISTDQYFLFTFTRWDSGEGPGPYGGYAFSAREVILAPACRITFSDGTYIDTAPAASTDRSLMPGVAFVTPTGSDITGTVGDQNLPYQSIAAAATAADTVIMLPGSYTETINLEDGKIYYAMPGVIFTSGTVQVLAPAVKASWLGSAIFTGSSRGLKVIRGGADIYFEFDKMDNNISFLEATVDCDININCNSILNTGASGFAGGGTVRDGANVNVNVKHFWHCNHRLIFFRQNTKPYEGRFEVTCPDIRILNGGVYGNAVKTVFEMDLCDGAEFIFNGNMTNDNAVLGTGLVSGILGITNHFAVSKFTINGDMDGGIANTCIWTSYRARIDDFIINGDITAANNFPLYLRPSGGNYTGLVNRMVLNGSKITGPNWPLSIEDGFEIYFRDCSFYNGEVGDNTTNIQYLAGEGDPSDLYFYNCIAETNANVAGEFITGGAAIGTLGCHNVVSADALGAGAVDAWTGYTVVANMVVPKF